MGLPWRSAELFRARFVDRPHRFLVHAEHPSRGRIAAHMPNPGRMWELLLPGCTLVIAPAPEDSQRQTRYTAVAVERDGQPVPVHTQASNDVVERLIHQGPIPSLAGAEVVAREVTVGSSRFDFLLRDRRGEFLLEVKSVTLFGNGVAMFPDAPTLRGRRHLTELAATAGQGARPGVLFLVHTNRVDRFLPDYHTDLAFSQTLLELHSQLRVIAAAIRWRPALGHPRAVTELPIAWDALEREAADRGSYLLLLRVKRKRAVQIGRLGRIVFAPGYWIYVGSAMAGLDARMARHLRRRKRHHWHIDYLRDVSAEARALPIRSSQRQECALAAALAQVLTPGPAGFGSSDCGCATHLLHSPTPPLTRADFHQVLQSFRMPRL